MADQEKTYGEITVGVGTQLEHKLKILDFIQAGFKDNRLASISMIEDNSYVIAIENPQSSGRASQSTMWLSKESVMAMLTTCMIYFTAKGENIEALIQEAMTKDQINYSYSDNLNPLDFLTGEQEGK